tara:strand:- start:1055 stop:1354 length:300 start_codon:yes stop_codon:yes gene_type:complete
VRVVWTYEAKKSFDGIFDYLMIVWSQKEAIAFIDLVEATIEKIKSYPKLFKISPYNNASREALLTKHTTMFYRVLEGLIEIEYLWGNFQDPNKIDKLLK